MFTRLEELREEIDREEFHPQRVADIGGSDTWAVWGRKNEKGTPGAFGAMRILECSREEIDKLCPSVERAETILAQD